MRSVVSFLSMALAVICTVGCASDSNGYKLSGHIEGLPDTVCLQLVPVSHYTESAFAETVAIEGNFSFEGEIVEPRAMNLIVKDNYGFRSLMLENGNIEISGEVKRSGNEPPFVYDFSEVELKGSPLTDKYDSLMSIRAEMNKIYESNMEKYKDVYAAINEASDNKDTRKINEIKASDVYKELIADNEKFFKQVESSYNKIILENKDSFWGPLLMISLTSYLDEGMKQTYEALSEDARKSYYGEKVKEELYPTGKIGTAVPAFTVMDDNQKEISLEELCKGKKYILIDFWASWCGPCRKEIPNLKNLYSKYAEKGFEIISISIDKKKEDWKKALEEEQLTWKNFLDETGVANIYKVKFVPTMYLIDSNMIMVGENLRGEDLAGKLDELFNE